jgi:hypothetical protein
MKKSIALGLALSGVIVTGAASTEVVNRVELLQTGQSARVHNPACATGAGLTVADLILNAGAAAIDHFTGAPFAQTILEQAPPGNRNWLEVRLGIHDGKSTCATICVAYPADKNANLSACLSETGGEGLGCFAGKTDDADPPAWAAIQNFTTGATAKTKVFCATGKNWSHNRNRWFIVKATW